MTNHHNISSIILSTIFLFALASATHTDDQPEKDEIDLKFYDLVEDVLREKYHNNEASRKKVLAKLKNAGIIEKIYDPELLTDREKLEQKLEPYLKVKRNSTKLATEPKTTEWNTTTDSKTLESNITIESATESILIHQIIIKSETSSGFDVCSIFTVQFFIGIGVGFVLGAPVGIGIILYLKRGKTYNYAISKPLPLPQT